MTTKLVQIGNSKGVRIPKAVLRQVGMIDRVNLKVRGRQIILEAVDNPRTGWDEAFGKADQTGDTEPAAADRAWLDMDNRFDDQEWTW